MSIVRVSAKGRIVLAAALRRRLGIGAGARIEVLAEADGLKFRVVRDVPTADVAGLADSVKAPRRDFPRRLVDFDTAPTLAPTRASDSVLILISTCSSSEMSLPADAGVDLGERDFSWIAVARR